MIPVDRASAAENDVGTFDGGDQMAAGSHFRFAGTVLRYEISRIVVRKVRAAPQDRARRKLQTSIAAQIQSTAQIDAGRKINQTARINGRLDGDGIQSCSVACGAEFLDIPRSHRQKPLFVL